jgi:VanZ family protein
MLSPLRWLSLATYTILIAVLSLGPGSGMPPCNIPHADKVAHFGLYALLMLVMQWALEQPPQRSVRHAAATFAVCVAYGGLMEYAQLALRATTGRMFSWADIAANVAGAASALAVLKGTYRSMHSRVQALPATKTEIT